jgi:cytosine/uracil/thiamine/allantoin permease
MIDFLKKYKTQIFNIITIFLILEFVIFPALTKADTISNIFAAIGLLLLIVWGGLALYTYVKGNEATKEIIEPKKKSNPKQFDGVKSDEPFVKTRKKSTTKKVK